MSSHFPNRDGPPGRSCIVPSNAFTISKLAEAAGVNIETIRYYQRRGILDEPPRVDGGFRAYDHSHLQRLSFIRRALDLGFSLDDAAELSKLSRAEDRQQLRSVARVRAGDIRERIVHLQAMADALEGLADDCAHSPAERPCPIVAALNRRDGAIDGSGHYPQCAPVAATG